MMNYTGERDTVWRQIEKAERLIIYGAQVVAYGVYVAIKEVIGRMPEAFVVSSIDNNPLIIDGILVIEFNENISSSSLVIVATPEIYHEDIKNKLEQLGIGKSLYVDTHMEYLIMSEYFRKKGRFTLLEDIPTLKYNESIQLSERDKDLSGVNMHMAKFHRDPILIGDYHIPSWIQPIQVGAALTDNRISGLQDNTGDNISYKNPNYSELTAMYWVWKNRSDEYMGICHYRRMLVLDNNDISKIKQNHINVVLPLPFVCYPDTSGQYGRYISIEDQQKMFLALKEVSPEYYELAKQILKESYLYNYNMFLADCQTYNDFCNWLFPILKRAEELCEPDGEVRKDRYIGYLGEVLTTIYFICNRNNLKIAHVEKKWMV
ncbi:MAG: DUF4422 domain-containing protein [Anaerolineaceae bacterium]|nr:MAG: DUF4422 domain-containing protein [Anaerolineaceae bacterium]